MEGREILRFVDHTFLKQAATWEEIRKTCEEGLEGGTASVCIPPAFVAQASGYLQGRLPVCTVIGFPNGYQTTETKVFEAAQAVKDGADEVDMVIRVGWAKEGRWEDILAEINRVKDACSGKLLKVIIEASLLSEVEKIALCDVVNRSKAEYIKTSTGFAGGGATLEDIRLFRKHMAEGKRIKAAGGIRSLEDAAAFLEAGADRLGSSSLVALCR